MEISEKILTEGLWRWKNKLYDTVIIDNQQPNVEKPDWKNKIDTIEDNKCIWSIPRLPGLK